jgi:hypothetical protein
VFNSGTRLMSQTRPNALYQALKRQVGWLVIDNSPRSLLKFFNPLRPLLMWNNNRIMKNEILPGIERGVRDYEKLEGPKTINNLAIKYYIQGSESSGLAAAGKIDPNFVDVAIAQMKIFLFAGHDTTASALSYIYYELYNNPHTLEAIRAEHDLVFGRDPTHAANLVEQNPGLLNQLPYTSAVIKETLRLFPPVGSIREGSKDLYITNPDTGARYPTEGFMLFSCSIAEHRHPDYWPRPNDFVPERWLAREGEPLYVKKNLFRPFELGPRNCIGQELAQTELRMILALTARHLDIVPQYPMDGPRLFGDLGYQVMLPGEVTAHPKQGMPAKVMLRSHG